MSEHTLSGIMEWELREAIVHVQSFYFARIAPELRSLNFLEDALGSLQVGLEQDPMTIARNVEGALSEMLEAYDDQVDDGASGDMSGLVGLLTDIKYLMESVVEHLGDISGKLGVLPSNHGFDDVVNAVESLQGADYTNLHDIHNVLEEIAGK